jgi:hypothetical protein
MGTFVSRMVRAMRLDTTLYEEVEADAGATVQALAVVMLSSLAAGLVSIGTPGMVLVESVVGLVGWFMWASITYLIGTKILATPGTRSDIGELLRVTGFAASPGLLRPLGALPGLYWPVFLVTGVWMLVAMIVAIRQALDYTSTLRAFGVALIGWELFFVFGFLVGGFTQPASVMP